MKKAKFINSESVEIINYEDFLKAINTDFDQMVKIKHVTDEELSFLEKNNDDKSDRFKKIREDIENERNAEIEKLSDYLEFIPCKRTDLEKFSTRRFYYTKADGKIYENETIVYNDKNLINCEINSLKQQLLSTDYIIIKAYEAKIMMQDAPYSDEFMTKTTDERQKIRDEINRLEELLKTVK